MATATPGFTEALKALVARLNTPCQSTLQNALGLCVTQTHYEVDLAHWLAKLLELRDSDLALLLRHYDVDPARAQRDATAALGKLRRGSGRNSLELSPDVVLLLREAWSLATLNYGVYRIRSGHLLAALLTEKHLLGRLRDISAELAKIPGERLLRELPALVERSPEAETAPEPAAASHDGPPRPAADSKTPALDQFTLNLSERAAQGDIDPVIGRDPEIRQVIDILLRRRQNNPILTGEAGVGKTAVVEGFALRVAAGDVPPALQNVVVRVLDLGLLQAGAGVKGEFENRLKSVIAESKASPRPIILFIDEAHTIIGAGGTAGQGDAANLLKPALARGELRTIAATTWNEYKKFFETDAALKRRFQVVKVEEPDEERAVRMMRGLTPTLEKHHGVQILEEAVRDAVQLSMRYIAERQLPDKSVSLLDTACARVALSQATIPPALEDCRRELEHLGIEIGILESEIALGRDEHRDVLQDLKVQQGACAARVADLEKRWQEEKQLVSEIQKLRSRMTAPAANGHAAPPPPEKPLEPGEEEHCRNRLRALEQQLRPARGEEPLVHAVVDRQAVAEVVAAWTGIPVGKMVLDEIQSVFTLRQKLEERVVGQSHALASIAERIQSARADLVDPRRPIGVFLLVGPSGVGKTETALALADLLYGGDRNMVVINMSEYKEDHKISRLTGSAPGYVGYGEGGVLTEAVRRRPYSVVLLDEVEKANESVQEIFYQVFDKGTLQDDKGNQVNFKNTIILLTSNVGTDTIMKVCADPETRPDAAGLAEALRPDLLKAFKPALLGRMHVVPYYPLTDDVIRQIVKHQLARIAERVRVHHRAAFHYDEALVETIAGRCKEVESGARNVDHILTGTLLPLIAQEFLARLAEGKPVQQVHVGVGPDGQFTVEVNAGNLVPA